MGQNRHERLIVKMLRSRTVRSITYPKCHQLMFCVELAFAVKLTSVEDGTALPVNAKKGNTSNAEKPAGIYCSYANHTETYSEEDELQLP